MNIRYLIWDSLADAQSDLERTNTAMELPNQGTLNAFAFALMGSKIVTTVGVPLHDNILPNKQRHTKQEAQIMGVVFDEDA